MGNFYVNYTFKGRSQAAIASALAGRKTVVTPEHNGYVTVFDEQSDEQDMEVIAVLAEQWSSQFKCPVWAVLNHDDDIFWYQLYVNGEKVDEYDSSPGYFDPSAEPSGPAGGNAQRLCAAFGASDVAAVETVLRKSTYDDDGYAFAYERHGDLVRALNLPEFGVGVAYQSFDYPDAELPDGLDVKDVLRTE